MVSFSSLGIVKNTPKKAKQEIEELISQLKKAFTQSDLDKSTIVSILATYIPNFGHIETGKSLDQKM